MPPVYQQPGRHEPPGERRWEVNYHGADTVSSYSPRVKCFHVLTGQLPSADWSNRSKVVQTDKEISFLDLRPVLHGRGSLNQMLS
jgi:hypothetical protein